MVSSRSFHSGAAAKCWVRRLICATERSSHLAQMHLEDAERPMERRSFRPQGKAMQQHQAERHRPVHAGNRAWGLGLDNFLTGTGGVSSARRRKRSGRAPFLRVSPERRVAIALLTNGGNPFGLYRDLLRRSCSRADGSRIPPRTGIAGNTAVIGYDPDYRGTYRTAQCQDRAP